MYKRKHSETTYIYTLSDPRTGEVRYVGKTKNLISREQNHRNLKHNLKSKSRNSKWIVSLLKKNEEPIFEVVDEVSTIGWEFWEIHYISLFKSWGFDLNNHSNGGEYGCLGCRRTEEHKLAISKAQKGNKHWLGRVITEEHRQKIRDSHLKKDKFYNQRDVLKVNYKLNKIVQIYKSVKECSEIENVPIRTVHGRLKEKFKVKGFMWHYKDEYESNK